LWGGGTILAAIFIFKYCVGLIAWLSSYAFPTSNQG
jgi:hypothetical protein